MLIYGCSCFLGSDYDYVFILALFQVECIVKMNLCCMGI